MTLSTAEIIRSKKHIFVIFSLVIFLSGAVVGCCLSAVLHIRLFDPMREVHQAREDFIDKTAALATTPEKQAELKEFIHQYFWTQGQKKFASFQQDFINELQNLQQEVKKYIPESKYDTYERYTGELEESMRKFPPPPPPPR